MKKYKASTISLIAVLIGFLLASLLLLVTGRNPVNMFIAILRAMIGFDLTHPEKGVNILYPLNWLLNSMPVILTGLSVAFAYRTGMFNIGGEGQFIVGALACTFVAFYVPLPAGIHTVACVLAGGLAGALWAFLPGFLKAMRNINEVVICIMLNYTALYLNTFMIRNVLPININTLHETVKFPETVSLGSLSFGTASKFNWGFVFVIIALLLYWFIIEKTSFGFSLRATGFNKEGARYAGMSTTKNTVLSMMIAGAFVGVAGAIVTIGVYGYGRIFDAFDNYGFDGISVALIGACKTSGILFGGLLIGLLKSATTTLQRMGMTKSITNLIQACILILIAIQYGIVLVLNMINSKKDKKVKEDA